MTARRTFACIAAVAPLALAGCSAGSAASTGPSARGPAATTADAGAAPAAGAGVSVTGSTTDPLTLAFVGDIHFEDQIGARLAEDPASVWGDTAAITSAPDLTFGNLETAIGTTGSPEPKTYTFRAPPSAFDALSAGGFDAVTMANNHGVDYGAPALAETLAAIGTSPVSVVGIGADQAQADAPAFLEAKGRRIAFLGASQIPEHTLATWSAGVDSPGIVTVDDQFVASVTEASTRADITIVYLHWGIENTTCATDDQESTADRLIAAGADIVVGSHSHMLMGAGWKDDHFVAYGLGNYLWYVQNSEETTRTGVFTVTVDGTTPTSFTYAPARIGASGVAEPLTDDAAATAQARLADLRESCTDLVESRTS